MANMTDVMEVRVNAYLTGGAAPAALTGPMRVRLLSALGTAAGAATDTPGTPITTGTTPAVAYGPTGTNPVSNAGILRWEGLPNPTTVAGFQVLDSAGTPTVTLDNIARTGGSVVVTDGIFEVAVGQLTSTTA